MDLGAPELLIILVIVGLLFGANRLPGLARGMGSAMHEFKKGQAEGAAGKTADKPAEAPAPEVKAVEAAPPTVEPAKAVAVSEAVETTLAPTKPAEPAP